MPLTLPLDLAMANPATNRVIDEPHLIDTEASRFFVPQGGPFFATGIELKVGSTLLMPGLHYQILHMYEEATLATGKEVDAIVYIKDTPLTPLGCTVLLTCHYVGGEYSATTDALEQILQNLTLPNADTLSWGSVLNKPVQYPPAAHLHHVRNIFGTDEMVTVLEGVRQAILQGDQGTINAIFQYIDQKIALLQNVINGGFATTTAVQTAIATHQNASNAHPKSSVGLGSVDNFATATLAEAQTLALVDKFVTLRRLMDSLTAMMATDAQAWEGANTSKLTSPATAVSAAKSLFRHVGDTLVNPNTDTRPIFICSGSELLPGGSDTVTNGYVFIIENIFTTADATTIPDVTTNRVQFAFGKNVSGIWRRELAGGVWSNWVTSESDKMERYWANANVSVFDNKNYDANARPTAATIFRGWKTLSVTQDDNIYFVTNRFDAFHRFSSLHLGGSENGEIVTSIGSVNLGGTPADVIKLVAINRHQLNMLGVFYLRRISEAALTAATSPLHTSQLAYCGINGTDSKLILMQAGPARAVMIDIVKSRSGITALVAREQATGKIGIMFSRYTDVNTSDPGQWGFGIPTTDNTEYGWNVLLATLGEATVTSRGTWHGSGSGSITLNSLDNFMKFREVSWGPYINCHAMGDDIFLVFTNSIVVITLTVSVAGELTATAVRVASPVDANASNGLFNNAGSRYSTFSYQRNGVQRLISVHENGEGADTAYSAPTATGSYTYTQESRHFTLRTDELDSSLPVSQRNILDIGYSGGLIWATIGSYDETTYQGVVSQLACVPWDPVASTNTILQLRTVWQDGEYQSIANPIMLRTPLVISDNTGTRLHLIGQGVTDFFLSGKNNYAIGSRRGDSVYR